MHLSILDGPAVSLIRKEKLRSLWGVSDKDGKSLLMLNDSKGRSTMGLEVDEEGKPATLGIVPIQGRNVKPLSFQVGKGEN